VAAAATAQLVPNHRPAGSGPAPARAALRRPDHRRAVKCAGPGRPRRACPKITWRPRP